MEFNGGDITIVMGRGDTDAVDANGNIIVNGGKIDVTAQTSSFDYDGKAEFNGGTIIINGTQVSEIPQSMMGGGMGGRVFGENAQMPNGEMPNMGERPDFGANGEMPNMGERPDFGANGEMPDFSQGGGRGGRHGRQNFGQDNDGVTSATPNA